MANDNQGQQASGTPPQQPQQPQSQPAQVSASADPAATSNQRLIRNNECSDPTPPKAS